MEADARRWRQGARGEEGGRQASLSSGPGQIFRSPERYNRADGSIPPACALAPVWVHTWAARSVGERMRMRIHARTGAHMRARWHAHAHTGGRARICAARAGEGALERAQAWARMVSRACGGMRGRAWLRVAGPAWTVTARGPAPGGAGRLANRSETARVDVRLTVCQTRGAPKGPCARGRQRGEGGEGSPKGSGAAVVGRHQVGLDLGRLGG